MANLYEANYQWANRPDDERFTSLKEMEDATRRYAESAATGTASLGSLRVEANGADNNMALVGTTGRYAKLTHYSFGQLAGFAKAPANYLRTLAPTLAAQNLNYGLKNLQDGMSENKLNILFHQNGSLVARAITSDNYDRVWNWEIIRAIRQATEGTGWVVPPARPAREGQAGTRRATAADILPNQGDFGLSVREGDLIAPAGLYASDHDMFMFLVNQSGGVEDGQKLLNRGCFAQNSEVGDCSVRFKFFLYDNVCGNHIVWGVSDVTEVALRHVKGEKQARGKTLVNAIAKWNTISKAGADLKKMEATIAKARELELGADREATLEAVFGFGRSNGLNLLTRKTIGAAYDLCEETPRYGAPTTVWGMVNGLTELSQKGLTDERTDLDTQAGRLMEIAF